MQCSQKVLGCLGCTQYSICEACFCLLDIPCYNLVSLVNLSFWFLGGGFQKSVEKCMENKLIGLLNHINHWFMSTFMQLLYFINVMSQVLKHSVIKRKGRRLQWKKQEFATFYSAQSRVPIKLI